ncbi:hypothetical protein ACH5RR_033588 [Cinchona calisaya]|uniref:Uncharacterized protein n=1 Tax=Cinchona calisaya TaxID=153742 RepID=A0ABD2YLB9_9GENT
MVLQHFEKGDTVEVLKRENDANDGVSVWFPATVLRSSSTANQHRKNQIYVEFDTLTTPTPVDRDDNIVNKIPPLREYVDLADVRPAPPQELHRFFKVGETAEAFKNKGWRKGKVLNILENSKYAVSFSGNGDDDEAEEVEQWGLRVFRDWDDGSWVPPLQLQKPSPESDVTSRSVKLRIKCSPSSSVVKFSKGMLVEVKSDEEGFQGSWYQATIVEPLGNDKFMVEYLTLKTEDETQLLQEEADISYIRPCPPEIQRVEPFELFAQVDAWYNDGWWVGHISRVIDGLKYMVFFRNTNEEMNFEHLKLRPHQDWIEGKWVATPEMVELRRSSAEMDKKTKGLKLGIKCSGNREEQTFSKGIMVEVKSDEEGYQGSWYTAVIIGPSGGNKFLVEYQTLRTDDESKPLREMAETSYIRPCPPCIKKLDRYKMLEEVDAWYNDGWWVGLVSKVLGSLKYAVYFWTSNEELEFGHHDLRPHQEWIGGKWITAFRKKSKLLMKSKLGKLKGRNGGVALDPCYCNGTKVEVKSDEEGYRGFWYPAIIVRPTGNGKYLVEYQTLKTDDGSKLLKEEADALCIRPCPTMVQQTERFKPLEEIDAWYNEGWWVGQVCKVIAGSKYTVYFKTTNEVLEFQHSDLRPHQDWINQQWIRPMRGRMQ